MRRAHFFPDYSPDDRFSSVGVSIEYAEVRTHFHLKLPRLHLFHEVRRFLGSLVRERKRTHLNRCGRARSTPIRTFGQPPSRSVRWIHRPAQIGPLRVERTSPACATSPAEVAEVSNSFAIVPPAFGPFEGLLLRDPAATRSRPRKCRCPGPGSTRRACTSSPRRLWSTSTSPRKSAQRRDGSSV